MRKGVYSPKGLVSKKASKSFAATATLFIKRLLLLGLALLIGFLVYRFLVERLIGEGNVILYFLLIWLMTAYIVLPRIHRLLTRWYIPDYFIGRVRTGDGLLGDPVNLAFRGSKRDIRAAMGAAGWSLADDLGLESSLKMARSTISRRSYINAPVSSLFLFGRRQDLAYQQEIDGNPSKRHHVRFWKVPRGWFLPGGFQVDWLAAGTYDRSVGLSLFTLQITHKIAEDTDEERDYIVATLQEAKQTRKVEIIKNYSTGYHHRNGGGDSIITDGALPIITL